MQPLRKRNNLAYLAVLTLLLGLCAWPALGQGAAPALDQGMREPDQRLNVFVSENKIVTLDFAPEEIVSSAAGIVKGEKVKGSENQVAISGVASGDATVTMHGGDRTIVYNVSVSPMPERLYINIPESKRLTFNNTVDEVVATTPGIVRIQQPSDKVLLVEALRQGKTTVTVTSGAEIFRYFVSTFDNRGADLLEIQNSFAAKGYDGLSVTFANDQATITGTVPTQEELDDAVRIVKQYTPYVIVKATIGAVGINSEDTEEERVVINNILRIANVKGLIVKVKFPPQNETHSTQYSKVVGAPALSTTVTDNQTRLTTSNINLPPADNSGATQRLPQEGSVEQVNITRSLTIPEKIFLFGELENDLDESRAIRVARTFCPLVISFITVKDPIQLRVRTRIVEVDIGKTKDVGVLWSNYNHSGPPAVTFGFQSLNNRVVDPITGASSLNFNGDVANVREGIPAVTPPAPAGIAFTQLHNLVDTTLNHLLYNFGIDASAQIRLLENRNCGKTLFDQSQLLTNGQPGEFFEGSQIPYSAGSTSGAAGTTVSTAFVNVGLSVIILPLNNTRAGGTGPSVSSGNSAAAGANSRVTTTLPKYLLGVGGTIDETIKYVDETGMIGLDITTIVSAFSQFVNVGNGTQAPQTTSREAVNRAMVRDGQSIVATGLFNDTVTRAITAVPFFNKIPLFGFLFENPVDKFDKKEVYIIYTPEIVRMKDPNSKRIPKPIMPELQKELVKQGDLVTQIKPVKYDASVEVRPELIKPAVLTIPKSRELKDQKEIVTEEAPPQESLPAKEGTAPTIIGPPAPPSSTTTTTTTETVVSPAVAAPAPPSPGSEALPVEQPATPPEMGSAGRLKMPEENPVATPGGNSAPTEATPTAPIPATDQTPAGGALTVPSPAQAPDQAPAGGTSTTPSPTQTPDQTAPPTAPGSTSTPTPDQTQTPAPSSTGPAATAPGASTLTAPAATTTTTTTTTTTVGPQSATQGPATAPSPLPGYGIQSYEGGPSTPVPGTLTPSGMGTQSYQGTPSTPVPQGTSSGQPSIDTAAPNPASDQTKSGADDSSTIP